MTAMPRALRVMVRVGTSLALIAAITWFFSLLVHVNASTAGFFYLVAILGIAAAWGLVESTIASIAAMLCYNLFFLPPVGTLTISDPQNWVALFAFLATSLTASQLSARAKRHTGEAEERRREMERLYGLSRSILLTDGLQPFGRQIVQQIAQSLEVPVALYERSGGEVYRAGIESSPELDAVLREVAMASTALVKLTHQVGTNHIAVAPVRLGREPIGSLAVEATALSDAAMRSLVNLVAIGLERVMAQETINRAEVARQSEELKSTLLDAIAHEFKTPLTTVKAVTTDLLSDPEHQLQRHQRELVTIADEGADRLSKLVTDAIQLARIEGGKFRLNREIHFPSSLIAGALRQMKPLIEGREIQVSAADGLPLVLVDGQLIQMVITHLVDNALKYSAPDTPICISATPDGNHVVISVKDHGPAISEEEQTKIFDRFYRGARERHLKGTGMGLAIAREIMLAHGENIWVHSRPGEGSDFGFSLPTATRSATE